MEDRQYTRGLKGLVARYLGLWVLPTKTYKDIQERCDREVALLQASCTHKKAILYYSPFVTCLRCQKVVREATLEELTAKKKTVLDKLNTELNR